MTIRPSLSILTVSALALSLAACKDRTDKETEVTVHVESDDGTVSAASRNGKATADAPGGSATVNTGGINLDSAHFDIDGVKLYPGSTIKTMNVNAVDKAGAKSANVTVSFESPADAKTVADYFQKEMTARKFTTARTGYDVSGLTQDGSDFSLKLNDLGGGKASGSISIISKK